MIYKYNFSFNTNLSQSVTTKQAKCMQKYPQDILRASFLKHPALVPAVRRDKFHLVSCCRIERMVLVMQ